MRRFLIPVAVAVVCGVSVPAAAEVSREEAPRPSPYLGQDLPGEVPEVFAPGVVSGAGPRLHGPVVVSPDGSEICWSVAPPAVMHVSLIGEVWSEPAAMPLDGRAVQAPAYSADGTRLYYQCVRDDGEGSVDIWWLEREGGGWGEPVNAGSGVNSPVLESQPSVAVDGTLYFTGTLEGSGLDRGIYVSRIVDGVYAASELLGGGINTQYIDYCPWIAPDESYLLFASSRPALAETLHLYVSFRNADGSWSEPVNIHEAIGFEGEARFPSVSPDGRILFFVSGEDAYWVEMAEVMRLRPGGEASEAGGRVKVEPALVVMDVQNLWLPRMAQEDRDSALTAINEAIALFRQHGYPVVAVYHSDPEGGPERGTEPFEFPSSIALADDDPRVVKAHASAFQETELAELLRDKGCNAVFLCGLSATGCVLATYFGAMERDFIPVMVAGTLLSPDASHTRAVEEICRSMTIDELRDATDEE